MPDPEHSQPRRRRGRPTVKPDLQKVENLAARGLTVEEIAHSLKISPATIYRRQAEIREFREAIRRGRAGLHLADPLKRCLTPPKRGVAQVEVWISGVPGLIRTAKERDSGEGSAGREVKVFRLH